MDGDDLALALRRNPVTRVVFSGCYLSSSLTNVSLAPNQALIVNTLTADDARRHRTGHYLLVIRRDSDIVFFDSFARPLSAFNVYIQRFVNKLHLSVVLNGHRLQNSDSCVCGMYCAYFLYGWASGHTLNELMHMFDDSTPQLNDLRVLVFYTSAFKTPLSTAQQRHLLLCSA